MRSCVLWKGGGGGGEASRGEEMENHLMLKGNDTDLVEGGKKEDYLEELRKGQQQRYGERFAHLTD